MTKKHVPRGAYIQTSYEDVYTWAKEQDGIFISDFNDFITNSTLRNKCLNKYVDYWFPTKQEDYTHYKGTTPIIIKPKKVIVLNG